jgi:hypothetical protein
VLDRAVEHGAFGPWDAGVGDEDVEAAVEFFDDLVDGRFDGLVGGDVDLVGLACEVLVPRFPFTLPADVQICESGVEVDLHFTPYSFSIFSASWMAFLLLLYQMATLAPASARPCATARPIPAPAPETMAVLPLRENNGMTRWDSGALVLLWTKLPPFMAGFSDILDGWALK